MSANTGGKSKVRIVDSTREPNRPKKPIIPSATIVVGLLVGLAGLVMTILGIGGVSVTHLSVSNTINIQTTSGGVLAMVIGLGTALFLQVMMIRVDLQIAKYGGGAGYSKGMLYQMTLRAPSSVGTPFEGILSEEGLGLRPDKGDASIEHPTVHVDFVGRPEKNDEYLLFDRDYQGITVSPANGDETKPRFYPWSSIFSVTDS